MLADCQRLRGDADCLVKEWPEYEAVTPADLQRVARQYLVDALPNTLSNVPRNDDGALEGAVEIQLP